MSESLSSTRNVVFFVFFAGSYPLFLRRTNLCIVPVPHTKQQHCSSSWLTFLTLCGFARFFNLVFGQLFSFLFGFLAHDWKVYLYAPYIYCIRTLLANCHDELTNGGKACSLCLRSPPSPHAYLGDNSVTYVSIFIYRKHLVENNPKNLSLSC
jgi:hypothetical protein